MERNLVLIRYSASDTFLWRVSISFLFILDTYTLKDLYFLYERQVQDLLMSRSLGRRAKAAFLGFYFIYLQLPCGLHLCPSDLCEWPGDVESLSLCGSCCYKYSWFKDTITWGLPILLFPQCNFLWRGQIKVAREKDFFFFYFSYSN